MGVVLIFICEVAHNFFFLLSNMEFFIHIFLFYNILFTTFCQGADVFKSSTVIDISEFLEWDGIHGGGHWTLTQEALETAVSQINRTRKTIYFPTGQYNANDPIKLDIANIFDPSDENRDMLLDGVRFIGDNRASKIQMGNYIDQTDPLFWMTWSSPDGF